MRSSERRARFATEAFRRRWRLASSTGCSALALVAGCGGSAEPSEERPALPQDVGKALLAETAEVEAALEAGNLTVARSQAIDLRERVIRAVNRRRIPAPLQEPLLAAVQRLVASIPAAEPPPPPPPAEEENGEDKGQGKKKGKAKGKDKGDGASETSGETTTGTTTGETTTGSTTTSGGSEDG